MTDEQKLQRKKSAESGHIKWIKDKCLRTKDSKENYVFISYKSDNYEKVLDDIVFKACKKYGLKVYFDTAFDDNTDSWINQFYDNMTSAYCKAFIAFIDNNYFSSYATLMELMASRTALAGGCNGALTFLSINLETIKDLNEDELEENTGLGTERFADGSINNHAGKELELFNELFSELVENNYKISNLYRRYKEDKPALYGEKTNSKNEYGKIFLKKSQCRAIMSAVMPDCNDNDGKNKSFVEVIYDKLKDYKVFIDDWKDESIPTFIIKSTEFEPVKSETTEAKTIESETTEAKTIKSGESYLNRIKALVDRYPGIVDNWRIGQIYSTAKEGSRKRQEKCECNGNTYYVNMDITLKKMNENLQDIVKKYGDSEKQPTKTGTYTVKSSLLDYGELQLGTVFDVGMGEDITISFNGKTYNTTSKNSDKSKGCFNKQMSRLVSDNDLKLGDVLNVFYYSEEKLIKLEKC